jgi:hypothetical protein
MRLGSVAAAALTLALAGCSADYVENSQAPVILQVTAINSGALLESDVKTGAGDDYVCPDSVDVAVAVRPKNPGATIVQNAGDIFLRRYEVRYTRTDGRAVEGVDVPYRVSGLMTAVVPNDGNATFSLEVVRRQAKLEPPLSQIDGAQIVTMFAEVAVFGENVVGNGVSASGHLQVNFLNVADSNTSCPSGN